MSKHTCPIRNFAIIAHSNHGKSTLADRLLEATGAVDPGERRGPLLDTLDLERERGISIKSQAVRLRYEARDGVCYALNLIDTPGHFDFNHEVSRSLAACEGVLLVVDASQGVEAQTLANVYRALDRGLVVIPVLNKIDRPDARPDALRAELEEITGLDADDALLVSARTGQGVDAVLEAIVDRVPPPRGDADGPLRALIFDSWLDPQRGVVALVRVVDGALGPDATLRLLGAARALEVAALEVRVPDAEPVDVLGPGMVGLVIIRTHALDDVRVGATLTDAHDGAAAPLEGFPAARPMVFAGFYPTSPDDLEALAVALSRLALIDPALHHASETSATLGAGFRCGFLGLLHMEVVRERLAREHQLTLLTSAPTVAYRATLSALGQRQLGEEVVEVDAPSRLPPAEWLAVIEEPYVLATIHAPSEHTGPILALCEARRGAQRNLRYSSGGRVLIEYELPLGELLLGFFEQLRERSSGRASLDHALLDHRPGDLGRLEILINGVLVDALSTLLHRAALYHRGRAMVQALRERIPRQRDEVSIQAVVGARVIARELIKAQRKDAAWRRAQPTPSAAAPATSQPGVALIDAVAVPHEALRAALTVF